MAVVKYGEDYVDIAKRFGLDAERLARHNNYTKLNAGQNVNLPRITAVGEKGFEYIVDTPGPGMQVIPHEQSVAMAKKGILPGRGMAIGGYLEDDPYGGIDPYAPPEVSYTNPISVTSTTPSYIPPAPVTTVTTPTKTDVQTSTKPLTTYVPESVAPVYPEEVAPTTILPTDNPYTYTAPTDNPYTYTAPTYNTYVPNTDTKTTYYSAEAPTLSPSYTPEANAGTFIDIRTDQEPPEYLKFLPGTKENIESGNTGTFTDTNVKLWGDYMDNPTSLSDLQLQQISGLLTSDNYISVYNEAMIDVMLGQQDVYGEMNKPPVPTVVIKGIDVQGLDPNWYAQYAELLASMGYSPEDINAFWLASLGYQFGESGMYMEAVSDPTNPLLTGGGGYTSGGGGGYGGYGGGGGGGGNSGYARYSSAISGLVNWRGVSFA